MAQCGSCHAPITWAVTPKGNRMPVNAKPDPLNGNVELLPPPEGTEYPIAIVHRQPPMMSDYPRHLAHFVTCPNADQWRKRPTRRHR